jgi:RNA polymerase sigma factor (sigma-70 family)
MHRWGNVIEMCKEHNRFAQNRLYDAFAGRMFRVCMRYLRHEQEAEEVLMNGFLKFFQSLSNFEYRDDSSLEAWLKRIMVNEALMLLRQQKNLPIWVAAEEAENEMSHIEKPDYGLDAEEIYAAILQLPTGYRTVFNLYVVEGYTHDEIAKQLNVSEGTSKSQLSKARLMLQQLLKQRGYEQYRAV